MKENLLSFFRKSALFCGLVLAATGCNLEEDSVEIVTEHIFVNYRDWAWNDFYARWECLVEWPYLTEDVYNEATVIGSVYVNETDANDRVYTTSKNLPFVHTFQDDNYRIFTETISFDVSPGTLCFYVQNDDLDSRREPVQDEYEFKVTAIWRRY
ncbi:MAG: hypothetical protein LBR65_07505 [Culturomica sp.]|nr:hypothetical protein [Culturomica sp.]